MSITKPDDAVQEYAHLLLQLHKLDPLGDKDFPELDAINEQMDSPWSRMNGREQKRLSGLSQDLYALADGRHGSAMTPKEKYAWAHAERAFLRCREPDAHLEHLRLPFPENIPSGLIAFFQARCWQQLGDL